MLSELSSIRLESQSNRPQSALVRPTYLDSIMLSLMPMRSNLYCAVSYLKPAVSAKTSEDFGDFLVDESEKLVIFVREASELQNGQSFNKLDGGDNRLPHFTNNTTLCNHSTNANSFQIPTRSLRKRWRSSSHLSPLGFLEVRFEEKTDARYVVPKSIVIASFRFTSNINAHNTGICALFRREMQTVSKPSISRHLHVIRQITREETSGKNRDDLGLHK